MLRVAYPLLVVLMLTALTHAQPTESTGRPADMVGPRLSAHEIVHDFGDVRPGTVLRWTFKLKNVGDADLLIHGVAPG
jgi:hypothetical protein